MKKLKDLTRYHANFFTDEMVEDADGYYVAINDVEEVVSELDDAFEHCKMDLESTKATVEELKERIAKADKLLEMFSDNTGYDINYEDYTLSY